MDENSPETKVSDLMQGFMASNAADKRQAFARRCWNQAAGESELRHTCGTFLVEPKPPHTLPLLVVYLDSSSLVVEYKTDRILYLARLEAAGLKIRDLDFKLSRNAAAHAAAMRKAAKKRPEPERGMEGCPQLDQAEKARVDAACQGLPEGLSEAFRGAMTATMRRHKTSTPKE